MREARESDEELSEIGGEGVVVVDDIQVLISVGGWRWLKGIGGSALIPSENVDSPRGK